MNVNPFATQVPLFKHGDGETHGLIGLSHLEPVNPLVQQHCWFQQLPPFKHDDPIGHPGSILGLIKRILHNGKFLKIEHLILEILNIKNY